jgi:hypothetical protein
MDKAPPQIGKIGHILGEPQHLVLLTSGRDSGDKNKSRATYRKPTPTTRSSSTKPRESDTAITSRRNGELTPKRSLLDTPSHLRQYPLRNHNGGRPQAAPYIAMYGLLLLGVSSAISHHLFYTYLNREAVDEAAVGQTWAIRIGSAFAYLFKTALVASIAVVYAQGFWFTVRRNLFEIGSIDNFFGLLTNPLFFYNRSLYGKARVLFALAMVSWLLPISAVIAPGALTGSCPLPTP